MTRPLGLLILGRQGSGKGTQAAHIASASGVVHISTGDMLRQAVADQTELGVQADAIMKSGGLVSDDIMIGIVEQRLRQDDVVARGFLLDGFPRTVAQAEALAGFEGVTIDMAINLNVPVEECTTRMMARGRDDDTEDAIRRRLDLYEAETEAPLRAWAEERGIWRVVDGLGTEDEVATRMAEALGEVGA